MRSKGSRRAAALLVASAAVMLTAACGGSSNGSGTATTGGGGNGGGMGQALTAYVDCMKQNGVTITLPSAGPRVGGSRGPGGYGGTRPSGEPRPRPSGSSGGRGFPGAGGFFQKPAGVDDATWKKAQAACASTLPSRGAGGFGRGNGMNQAYRNCLKQHGVTLDNGRPNASDPTVQKAMQTCKVLQPTASPTPSA